MSDIERKQLISQISGQIERMMNVVYRKLTANMITDDILKLEMTMLQMKTVFILYQMGPQRMGDMAHTLSICTATMTGIVDRLVKRDYIIRERDPDDRRVVICRLSENGANTISNLWSTQTQQRQEMFETLSTRHLEMFTDGLSKIEQVFKEMAQNNIEPKDN